MSKKQWLVLLMLFLTYLLLGASIFYHIESRLEIENVKRAKEERIEINALLHEHYMLSRTHSQHEILEKLTQYCGKSVYNYTEGETDPLKWDFYNSFYFAYTVVSTIGYGNLAPTNMLGRILMIFYGLVGIPMNGILLTQLGEFFGQVFVKAHQKYKSYKAERSNYYDKKLETRRAGLAAQIFVYLTPGFIMFIFFPAFLFSHYEGWSYDEAVYYAFVTLTTIGFGDYVAGQDNTKGSGVFFILYKTFLICWISFGLGYIVMIMTFIARGMRSKKIIRIEHKLAMNLKHTQNKIWNEFNKEVNYLRRVFNELQLSKVKRVYVDESDYDVPPSKFSRSNSFPDLRDLTYGSIDTPTPPHPRRRANSEVVPTEEQLTRVVSETDLQRIDKNATFAAHAIVQPAELFAKLVNVLGYVPPPSADNNDLSDWEIDVGQNRDKKLRRKTIGVDGFSEKEILASENTWNGSSWKVGNERFFPAFKPRSRAASEVRLRDTRSGMVGEMNGSVGRQNGEWTWSGPGTTRKIQEFIKNHSAGLSNQSGDSKPRKFPSLSLPISMPKGLIPRWKRQTSKDKKDSTHSVPPVTDSRDNLQDSYVSHPSGVTDTYAGRSSFSFDTERSDSLSRKFYYTHTGASNMPGLFEGSSSILEETSLGDFLRALTVIHSTVGALPDDYAPKPKRKMGTASLTPPKLPSLFTLFTGSGNGPGTASGNATPSGVHSNQTTVTGASAHQQIRRLSLWNNENSSDSSVPPYTRRRSLAPVVSRKPRRFSLRPVATPVGTPPNSPGTPCLSTRHFPVPTDQSTLPANSSFVDESQKKPLVKLEGAPGVSSPITSSPTGSTSNLPAPSSGRRFSLRPAQIGMPPAPRNSTASSVVPVSVPNSVPNSVPTVQTAASATVPSAPIKPLPRWKAGMLERKIGRMSVRRRARAFSLSDVQTDRPERLNELSPLAAEIKSAMLAIGPHESFDRPGNKRNASGGQKTVTIVSPGASSAEAKPWNYPRTSLTSLTSSSNPFDDATAGTPRSYASTPTVSSTSMVIQPVAKNEYVTARMLDPSMETVNYCLAGNSVAGEGGSNLLVPDSSAPPSFGTFAQNSGGIIGSNLLSPSRTPSDEEIRRTQVLTTEVDSSGLNNKNQPTVVMEQQRDAQTVVTITTANEPAEWVLQTKSNDDLAEVKVDKPEQKLSGGESRDLSKENT